MLKTEKTFTDYQVLWKEKTYKTNRKTIDLTKAKRILDKNDKPTDYFLSDNLIFRHNPQHIESWDDIIYLNLTPELTEVLDNEFIKDDKKVFLRARLQRGVNPKTFQLINHLFAGNEEIILTRYGNAKVEHPKTFKVLDDGLTPSTFSSQIGGYQCGYAIDKEFAYYFDESTSTEHAIRVKACKNPSELQSLGFGFAKDDKNIFLEGRKITKAKPDTFKIINRYYATDGKHIFYRRDVLDNADVASFEILPTRVSQRNPDPILNSYWAKDKNHYYDMHYTREKSDYEKHINR